MKIHAVACPAEYPDVNQNGISSNYSAEFPGAFTFAHADNGNELLSETVLKTIPVLHPEWSVSLDVYPTGNVSSSTSILRLSHDDGDRTPAIFFQNGQTKVLFTSAVNGNSNYGFMAENTTIPLNQWTTIKASQTKNADAEYVFSAFVDGIEVHSVKNNKPATFTNVTVYAGDPWHQTAAAKIRNVYIEIFGGIIIIN